MRLFFCFFVCFTAIASVGVCQHINLDSIKQSAKASTNNDLAELIRVQGLAYKNKGEYERAQYYYTEALQLFIENKDSAGIAKTYNNLGLLYQAQNRNRESITAFYSAIEINLAIGNQLNLGLNYMNLGIHYKNEAQYEKAYEYFTQSKNIILKTKDQSQLGSIYSNLANLFSILKSPFFHYDSAIFYYETGLKSFEKTKEENRIATTLNNMAILSVEMNRPEPAKDYYEQSLVIKEKLNDPVGQMNTLYNLGTLYLKEKAYATSLEYYEKALALADQLNDKRLYLDIVNNIIKAEVALGNAAKIEPLFDEYSRLRDSLFNEESMQQLRTLETIFETDKIGRSLEVQKQITAKTRKQNQILIGLSISIILLVILTVLFFIQRQKYLKKLRTEEMTALKAEQEVRELNALLHGQEEERSRIASDLHDRLGARLSLLKMSLDHQSLESKQDIINHINDAIKDTREISHNLSSDILTKYGLEKALKEIVSSVNKSNQLTADYQVIGLEERLTITIERSLYFILLELVNNAIKHSEATHLFIQIGRYDNQLNLFFEDNGRGIDLADLPQEGMGLRSMKARASSIGANLVFESSPDHGFKAILELNLSAFVL